MNLALSESAWSGIATVFSVVLTAALRTWYQNRVEARQNAKIVEQAEAVKLDVKSTVQEASQDQKEAVRTSATRLSEKVEDVQEKVNGRISNLLDSNSSLVESNASLVERVKTLESTIARMTGQTTAQVHDANPP